MKRMHRARLSLAILAVALVTAGCTSSGDTAATVRDAMRRLPALNMGPLPVDIDATGRIAEVYGFDTKTVDAISQGLGGPPLIGKVSVFPQKYVTWFTQSNIQHITIASRTDGLFILVNGEPLPYLAWDKDAIDNLVTVLGKFERDRHGAYLVTPDVQKKYVETLLPLLPQTGLRVDFRFPMKDGATEIPLPTEEAFSLALTDAEMEAAPLQQVALTIDYVQLPDDPACGDSGCGWVPSLNGLSTVDLKQIVSSFGSYTFPKYRLRRDIESRLRAEHIASMGLEMRHDGIFLQVDGKLLPHLAWSDQTLTNLSTVLEQLYQPAVTVPKESSWVPVVKATAPLYNDLGLAVTIKFPVE